MQKNTYFQISQWPVLLQELPNDKYIDGSGNDKAKDQFKIVFATKAMVYQTFTTTKFN